jgi:hypothetical protein
MWKRNDGGAQASRDHREIRSRVRKQQTRSITKDKRGVLLRPIFPGAAGRRKMCADPTPSRSNERRPELIAVQATQAWVRHR